MTDPIADMINRIKNAQAVSKETVKIPYSSLKYEIAKILKRENWINEIEKKNKIPKKIIEIQLKNDEGKPAISGLKRVSSPGQRIYSSASRIKRVKDGTGMAIVSTPQGLMTDREARNKKSGGEILFEIW
jgi:small subunit ribosomal protein S8